MYDMKALYEAHSVEEAVALRLEHPEAQIIAGGSDVLVQMREGKRAGAELISIYGIDAMRGICIDEDGNIRIGSLTSFSHITRDPIIRKYINVLGEAVDMVGGPQIRNIGTIGGNTCNGVTSADSASTPCAACPSRTSTSVQARWTSVPRRARSRRPSSSRRPAMKTASATISNTPCATPWTSPRQAAP